MYYIGMAMEIRSWFLEHLDVNILSKEHYFECTLVKDLGSK